MRTRAPQRKAAWVSDGCFLRERRAAVAELIEQKAPAAVMDGLAAAPDAAEPWFVQELEFQATKYRKRAVDTFREGFLLPTETSISTAAIQDESRAAAVEALMCHQTALSYCSLPKQSS